MLFTFLKKQKYSKNKKRVIETMIASLTIDPEQKELYFESLNILGVEELDDTYEKLTRFVKKIELKEIGQIQKESFSTIAGMRKKEAEEKLEDINSLSLLFNNI